MVLIKNLEAKKYSLPIDIEEEMFSRKRRETRFNIDMCFVFQQQIWNIEHNP